MLSGTLQNIVGLVIKDKYHPTYTSEVLDDLLLLAQYYARTMYFVFMSNNRSIYINFLVSL